MKKLVAIIAVLALTFVFAGQFNTAWAAGEQAGHAPNIQLEQSRVSTAHVATAPQTQATKEAKMDCCKNMAANSACGSCCTKDNAKIK